MAEEPLPRNFDYQGNERGLRYVRGVTHVRCPRCATSGIDPRKNDPTNICGNVIGVDVPICRHCGGYGCISKTEARSLSIAQMVVQTS